MKSYKRIFEGITLDINPQDILLSGKFRNKPVTATGEVDFDDKGTPIIKTTSGKGLKLNFRIKKLMPEPEA